MPGIGTHDTATSTGSWDGDANRKRLPNDADKLKAAHAYAESEAGDTKGAYKFIHHEVDADGNVGAANLTACTTGIAILNGAREGTNLEGSDKDAVYRHLASHLRAGDKEVPDKKFGEDGQRHVYWTDIADVELAEDGKAQWVHLLPIGEYKHPLHGTIKFTKDRIKRFAQNVKDRVRGIDPYVNFDHRETSGEAAGWIKDAEARDNGLWAFVEWTEEAANKIKDKKYRYLSSEYSDVWEDPEGNVHEDVVIGAALTNVPYLKNLVPVNLSELAGVDNKEEDRVEREELARLLGLSEDATEDDIKAKLTELAENGGTQRIDLSNASIEEREDGSFVVKHEGAEGEVVVEARKQEVEDDELAKLAEEHPAVKKLNERLEELETTNRLNDVKVQLSEIDSAGKKNLPPVAEEKFRNLMVRLPKQLSDEVYAALAELTKAGFVEVGQRTAGGGKPEYANEVAQYLKKLDELTTGDGAMSTRDAVRKLAETEPELARAYKEATRDGENLVSLSEEA